MEEDQPIEHKLLSGQIEQAQKRVESNNFNIRKHVLQYDDVLNVQREIIYSQRRKVLEGENLRSSIMDTVSYTHLDVYKRQPMQIPMRSMWCTNGRMENTV